MQYKKDYLKSRGYEEWDFIMCEIPWCYRPAVEVHHIESSYKWLRKHNKDWSNLLGVCRNCHDKIHNKNNTETREYLLWLVNEILSKNSA